MHTQYHGQVLLSTPFTVGGLCKHPCAALTFLPSVNGRSDNFDSIFKRHLSSPQDSDCSSEMRGCTSPLKAAEFCLQEGHIISCSCCSVRGC